MSGVGITGKIEPLNGGAFPVYEDINGQGGLQTVADITARNAVSANPLFCKEGMQVYVQNTQTYYQLAADLTTWNVVGAPFKATYYVDSSFTGVSAGSQSNPFKTIAAAFTAAAALALTGGIVYIPPGATHTENVVYPTSGQWEISSPSTAQIQNTRISGAITINTTAQAFHSLSNVIALSAVSGDKTASATNRLYFRNVVLNSSLSLTASGGGNWLVYFDGTTPVPNNATGLLAGIFGTTTIIGALFASSCNLENLITVSADSSFVNVYFNQIVTAVAATTGAGVVNLSFADCVFKNPAGFSATSGSVVVNLDGASFASACVNGISITSGTGSVKTSNSNASSITTETNNRATTNFSVTSTLPEGLYEILYDSTLLVQGTAGLLQVNVIYTDMTGTLVTVPVGGTLNIASAVGTKSQGSLSFHHNGSSKISFSTTGIVTPGAMSVSLAVTLRRTS